MTNKHTTITKSLWHKISFAIVGVVVLFVGVSLVQGIADTSAATPFQSRFCIDLNSSSSPNSNPRVNCMTDNMAAEGDLVIETLASGPIPGGGTELAVSTAGWTSVVGYHTAYLCADVAPPLGAGAVDEIDEGLGIDGYPGSGNCMEYAFIVGGTCADGIDNTADVPIPLIDADDPSCYTIPGDVTSGYDPTLDETPGFGAVGTCSLVQGSDRENGEFEIVIPIGGGLATNEGASFIPPIPTSQGPFTVDSTGAPLSTLGINGLGIEGLYEVTLESYDGWGVGGRSAQSTQDYEQWEAVFSDGVGFSTTSEPSEDLPDGDFALNVDLTNSPGSKTGVPLDFTSPVTQVTAQHAFPTDTSSGHSLHPVCIGLNPVPVCTLDGNDYLGANDLLFEIPVEYGHSDGKFASNLLFGAYEDGDSFRGFPNTVYPLGQRHPYLQLPHGLKTNKFDASSVPPFNGINTGIYEVTLQAYDAAPGRNLDNDSNESWRLKFHNSIIDRNLLTPRTQDLKDFVYFASSSETFQVDFGYSVSTLQPQVGFQPSEAYSGSTRALCAGFKYIAPTENTCDPLAGDYVIPIGGASIHGGEVSAWADNSGSLEIPPGYYDVTLKTYDPHNDNGFTQLNEIWRAELDTGDGDDTNNVFTGITGDLADAVNANNWVVDNELFVGATTTQLRAVHAGPDPGEDSLVPVCAVFDAIPMPNLTISSMDTTLDPSTDWYPDTGFWHYVDFDYALENDGTADAGPFRVDFYADFSTTTPYRKIFPSETQNWAGLNLNTERSETKRFGPNPGLPLGVPPGDYHVEIDVDTDISIDPWGEVKELNESDNHDEFDVVYLAAPKPTITLDINPGIVRYGETADIDWTINATFPMICTLNGPGLSTVTFAPVDHAVSPALSEGSITSGSIKAKSEYVLQCKEQVSGHEDVTSATAIVETTGKVEEI